MSGNETSFDAVVIGSGVGGICAAARLAHQGYRTLVMESLPRVGGRASTREVDGFLLNTGALVIERGGPVEQTLIEIGAPPLHLYVPKPETVLRWGHLDINASTGPVAWARVAAPNVLKIISALLPPFRPQKGESVTVWLNRFTKSAIIHGLVDNVVGAMFAASGDDLPADVFIHYFTKGSAFKKIGLMPGGTIEVWKLFAAYVEAKGGAVWLNSPARRITFSADGLANGVEVEHDGKLVKISTKHVISNLGPVATVELAGAENFPAGYAESVAKATDPSAIITVHFASRTPLAKFQGLALVANSRRLVYAGNFSAPEQKRAPAGWYLYCGASVPKPARGEFDLELEKELLYQDLREQFPGFDQAKILAVDVTAHEWPAQRAVTGFDLPQSTPVANLWNVGDGVKPWGDAGTAACAETARTVVDQIVANDPEKRFQFRAPAVPATSRRRLPAAVSVGLVAGAFFAFGLYSLGKK